MRERYTPAEKAAMVLELAREAEACRLSSIDYSLARSRFNASSRARISSSPRSSGQP